nr:class E sortase [Bifidobacterium phasiani]
MRSVLGVVIELLFTLAAVCALYIVWQMWWTGVEAEHAQVETRQSADWVDPAAGGDEVAIAQPQEGDPPVQPEGAAEGDLVAEIYIPRFGDQWVRNIVEGTSQEQLNRHGMGHYETSQMPGELGNFAVAGHRNGYGQPLADVDLLQEGDAIVVRTQDYWYVYRYTTFTIVTPDQVEVVAANPENPGAAPTKRMITLTTCEPKYTTATKRWISYGELEYWARVSDGVPAELTSVDETGAVRFINNEQPSVVSRLGSLQPVVVVALLAYLVIFIAAAIVWRWPVLREIREGARPKPDVSIYGGLLRHQPGVLPVRVLLLALLLVAAAAALLQWGYPWLAANIPFLQAMSNYVTV